MTNVSLHEQTVGQLHELYRVAHANGWAEVMADVEDALRN